MMGESMKGIIIMFLYVTSILLALSACGDLEPKGVLAQEADQVPAQTVQVEEVGEDVPELVISDLQFSENVFQDYKWYSYNILNHRVYPNFDVYVIQSKGVYYKLQIIDYYAKNDPSKSGVYNLRIEGQKNSNTQEVVVDASGCGAPTGGVAVECDADETYTLIDLSTQIITQMTAEDAVKTNAWDIGFKRTDVILNSSSIGLGNVTGALVYRNKDFFNAFGLPRYQRLTDAYVNGGELDSFNGVGRLK